MGNAAEKRFVRYAARRFTLVRHGWPDFFARDLATEEFLCIEVKQGDNKISAAQRLMFAALEASGFKVVVWNPKRPKELTPWQSYKIDRQLLPKPHAHARKTNRQPNGTKRTVVYVRIRPEVRARIVAIAAERGLPHSGASVASEMVSRGLKTLSTEEHAT